jgi:hypothetical protein
MDGQTECINHEIEQYLHVFIDYHQADWVDCIPVAEFAYNNKVSSATAFSPFYLNHEQDPGCGTEVQHKTKHTDVQAFKKQLDHAQKDAKSSLT